MAKKHRATYKGNHGASGLTQAQKGAQMRTYAEDVTSTYVRIPVDCPYCEARLLDVRFRWLGDSPETARASKAWQAARCEDGACGRPFAFKATMQAGYSIEIRRRWIPD